MVAMSEVPGYTDPLNPLCFRGWMKVSDQGPMLDYMRKRTLGLLAHPEKFSKGLRFAKVFGKRARSGEVTYPVESLDFISPVNEIA
jgi:hypothetical protein